MNSDNSNAGMIESTPGEVFRAEVFLEQLGRGELGDRLTDALQRLSADELQEVLAVIEKSIQTEITPESRPPLEAAGPLAPRPW